MTTPTYTRREAEQALGIKSRSAFIYLRNKYPKFFVVVQEGLGRYSPTLYDREKIDRFIAIRKELRS